MRQIITAVLWFPLTLLILAISLFILSNYYPKSARNPLSSIAGVSDILFKPSITAVSILSPREDFRKNALRKFFTFYKSPLVDHLDVLIREADANGIDYALIPAIAMQESQGCKAIPDDSYNCWGFGIYGKTVTRFQSYDDAIIQVAKTIKETYIKGGLTNPTLLEDRWAPQSRGLWSYSVNFFISKLREYEKNLP